MSKTITSPVKEFPGTVKLPNHLTMPQVLKYEKAIVDGSVLVEEKGSQTELEAMLVEALCECVEEWNLDNFGDLNAETFPFTPRAASSQLVAWLVDEIGKLYNPEVPE